MRRQGRVFPEVVFSIVSSHQPALMAKVSLTLTDNWWFSIPLHLSFVEFFFPGPFFSLHEKTLQTLVAPSAPWLCMSFLVEPSLNHLAFIIRHMTSNSIYDIRVDSSDDYVYALTT